MAQVLEVVFRRFSSAELSSSLAECFGLTGLRHHKHGSHIVSKKQGILQDSEVSREMFYRGKAFYPRTSFRKSDVR